MPKSYYKILLFERTRIRQHKIFFIFWTRITLFAYLTTVIHIFHTCFQFSAWYSWNSTDSIKFIHQLIAKGDLPSIWAPQFPEMPSYFMINSM